MDTKMALFMVIPFIVFLVICCIFLVFKSKEKELLDAINRTENDSESMLNDNEIKDIVDSLKNHLNEEKMRSAIELLNSKQYAVYSDNGILNSLINSKIEVCDLKNIDIKCGTVDVPDKVRISETVALFGNLLDNSIEAAELCVKNGLEGGIDIECGRAPGVWMLKISNSKLETVKPVLTRFMTTKKDKYNHGLGMRIIREIVNAHDGTLKVKDLGKTMEIMISFWT